MKRAASQKLKFIAVLTTIFSVLSFQPASAATFLSTTTSSCTGYGMTTYLVWAEAITIPSAAVITGIDYKASGGSTPTGSRVQILADNSGAPSSTLIGTLAYNTFNANIANYLGSVNLSTAGRYWFALSSPTSGFSPCYTTSVASTSVAAGWSLGSSSYESSNSGTTYPTNYPGYHFLFTIYGTGGGVQPTASSITLSGNSTTSYRQPLTVTATLGVAGTDGKVTFFANGKRVSGCINKQSSSLSASCSWKPSRRGAITITATLTPTDTGFASSTSVPKTILVGTRTNTR